MKTSLRLLAMAGLLALAACDSDPAGPEPEPVAAAFTYGCNTWLTDPPDPSTVVLADVEFAGETVDEAEVRRRGGRVVYRFHVPRLRVAIQAGMIPFLRGVWSVHGVTDPADLDVRLYLRYSRPVTDADLQALAQVGARELQPFSFAREAVGALVADPAIPAVRALPGVTLVERMDGIACLADVAG